jgi:hypothetical protein
LRQHDPARARLRAERELRLAERIGDPLRQAAALDILGSCLAFEDLTEAATAWTHALEIYQELRHRMRLPLEEWLRRLKDGVEPASVIELDFQRRCLARRMI